MSRFRKYGCCYAAAGIAAAMLKLYYSRAGSDELLWILAPVVRWVGILSGITFEYLPGIGFVNHSLRFVVAPSCSGVQFLMTAMLMSVFSFTHRMRTVRKGFSWAVCSTAGIYLYTVFINGIRIVLSVYLPQLLQETEFKAGWLTQKRLHTIIGTTVYFVSLLILYQITDRASRKIAGDQKADEIETKRSRMPARQPSVCLPPFFWYYMVVLGLPFLNRAWSSNRKDFTEYACLITVVCLIVLILIRLLEQMAGKLQKKTQV